MTPWEHNPALTEERLVMIGQLIRQGRNDALDRYDQSMGCDGWTVGCEAFAFQKHQIIKAAGHTDWLEILNPSMEFVFSIGGIPVRFYRGEAADPHERTLRQTFAELNQMSLFGSEELERAGARLLHRFAVETDFDGSITRITFVVLDGSTPMLSWIVPLDKPFAKISPLWVEGSEGVVLPFPTVRLRGKEDKEQTGE
jgi:hypothetical protein